MCRLEKHTCYCGKVYDCQDPNWLCSTINDDEDRNMCPACLDKFAAEYQAWCEQKGEGNAQ